MSLCASCGAELSPDWKFCIACGAPIVSAQSVAADITAPEVVPAAIRPEPMDATQPRTINMLAILALVLGCIGGPPALIFGHYAISQIKQTGERGIVIARVATVLGYLWLAVWIVGITLWLTGVWR